VPPPSRQTEFGLSILSGRAGAAWSARAQKLRPFLKTVLGDAPPTGLPVVPFAPARYVPGVAPAAPFRSEAVAAAGEVFDALSARRFRNLEQRLEDAVWVQWPSGAVLHHPRRDLLAQLENRAGRASAIRAKAAQSYTFAELRNVLARGVTEGLDVLLRLRTSIAVTFELEGAHGAEGRGLFSMSQDREGRWRARNLLLAAPDDAFMASSSLHNEDDAIRLANQVIRRVVLGHAAQIRAARHLLMDELWVRDRRMKPDELARVVGEGPHRLPSAQTVFLGTRIMPFKAAERFAPRGVIHEMRASAPDLYGKTLAAFDPALVIVEIGLLDPASGKISPNQEAGALVLKTEDPARHHTRFRIAGLFL
jgi:hypothetical protein